MTGDLPNCSRLVVIVAPHTSNWDFVVGIAARLALRLRIHWLGKHTLFRGLFGRWMRRLGGIPINRSAAHGAVEQVIQQFQTHKSFLVGLSPEGTRKKVPQWKSGFYHIAVGAEVPILPIHFDYDDNTWSIGLRTVAVEQKGQSEFTCPSLFIGWLPASKEVSVHWGTFVGMPIREDHQNRWVYPSGGWLQ